MVPPSNQNTAGVCNKITLLILYTISSRLVTILKATDAPKMSLVFFILLLVPSSLILDFRYFFFIFVPALSSIFTSSIVQIITLLLFGFCNRCILACFLWSKNRQHSSSYHNVYCFTSYRFRLSIAAVLVFSLMFSQVLFMSSLSFKFSRTANVFEILIWFRFLTSSSLIFLRLNLSVSNFCTACFLLPIFT